MRYIQESRITNKASRETGALTLFSRRAHLLTTDEIGGVLHAQSCALRGYVSARRANIFTIVTQERK